VFLIYIFLNKIYFLSQALFTWSPQLLLRSDIIDITIVEKLVSSWYQISTKVLILLRTVWNYL